MIGKTLAHYTITAKLGEGGMGAVYRAADTKLGRDVALKVLPAEMASSPERLERFQREAKALAALDHPGIVTVYSVEESDGVHFLTMQLIEGQPLDEVIPVGGLSVERILEVGSAVAEALTAAHEKGIVHRDLKPANVMIAKDGRVKVLDFGLARMGGVQQEELSDSDLPTELHTREGVVMGTVPYMSPEQVSGRVVDHQTDIFSLGIILYEMATGQRPFQGPSSAELVSSILRDTPRPLGNLRADLPEGLTQAIEGCLSKSTADRVPSAIALREALGAVTATPLSVPTSAPVASRPAAAADSGAARADEGFWVAVLPFKYSGADTDVATLAEGLAEEIVTGLSRFSYLKVISRSALRAVSESMDLPTVGQELGARYVMEGSLRQAGSQLRVAVQLVDASTGAHLWAETYDRPFQSDEIFTLQDELVPRIVSTVADMSGVLPRSMSEAVRSRPTEQLSHYEAVLRSFGYFERLTPEELAEGRSGLEMAVENVPTYADAWAMLALLCVQEFGQGFNLLTDPLATGANAAQRAVEAGPSNHLAHLSLAQVHFFQKEFQGLRNAAEKAVALNPMDGNSIAFLGEMLTYTGDFARGLELASRAKQLNPNHPGWYWYTDFYHAYRQGDDRGALGFLKKVNLPGHWGVPAFAAAVYGQLGEHDAAAKAAKDLLGLRPDFAATVRGDIEKWFEPEYVERLIDGWRKAGLDVRSTGETPVVLAPEGDASATSESDHDAAVAIAVLPFSDMSPAKDQEYLCEGMAEEIMNALVKIDGLRVASRTSAFRARQDSGDLSSIARALSVGHILEGSVRTAGSRLRVTAQLTDVASGFQLWSERFDRKTDDIFAVQDEIAAGVVEAVRTRLASGPVTIQARPQARDLEAYRWFLKGRHLRGKEDHEGAQRAFDEAIRLDPSYAPAWTALAETTVLAVHFGMLPAREGCMAVRKALATAAELQGESAEGLHVEAFLAFVERRWAAMEAKWRRALKLQPTHVLSLGALGLMLCTRQRLEDGLPFLERALETDPLASFPYARLAVGYLINGRPEEALRYAQDGLIFEKEDVTAVLASSMAKVVLGRLEEGIAEAEQAVELSRRGAFFVGILGWALATAGRNSEARALLQELRSRPEKLPITVSESWLLGALGKIDEAFEAIDRAEEECQSLLYYTGFPGFDPLRADPRFAALLTRLELPTT